MSRRRVWDIGFFGVLLLVGGFVVHSWREEEDRDLLHLIDPAKDAIVGEWELDGAGLVSSVTQWARIQIPYLPPDEYDLTLVAERKEGHDALAIGLTYKDVNFALWIDGFPNKNGLSGLDLLEGSLIEVNPASVQGIHVVNDKPLTIGISVRKRGVTVMLNDRPLLQWRGEYSKLSPSPVWTARDPRIPLFVGADSSRVRFSKIVLTPVSGQGKRLR